MSNNAASIDGRTVTCEPGMTILQAARHVGVDIPTLCYSEALHPEGGCRVCLVEVEGKRPHAACHTAIQPGMAVRTDTTALQQLRRGVLALNLTSHQADRFATPVDGDGEVHDRIAQVGLDERFLGDYPAGTSLDASHPYMRFDERACITCRRCLNACEQVQGQFVYGIAGRGPGTRLIFGPSETFAESNCTACGACIDECPTGAITDRDRLERPPAIDLTTTDSVCGYCGVGCRLQVEASEQRVVKIRGVEGAVVNNGHLCLKGRFAHAYHHHADRLTQPLLRDGDGFRPVDWDEALAFAAEGLTRIRDERGPNTLAALSSSRSTNEAAYLLQKLFRTAIGTNNIDCCARVCHSSTALALQMTTGAGAASASFADIERARCIVVAGANPTEAHPVVGARIKQAALRGATLIVIDPRRVELAEYADVHLQLRPGTNVALFNAMAKLLLEAGHEDRDYSTQRCEGVEELAELANGLDLNEVASITHVSADAIAHAAALIGRAGPTLFVHGLGLSELTQGTASVITLANLGMLTGSIGKRGAGMLPLRGQNNVQGNADMGGMPNMVTGYQDVGDDAVRDRLMQVWPSLPPREPGWTSQQMIDTAARGELRGLWCQGEDMAQSDPNESRVLEALRSLDLLIVQDPFMCETARYAHLVLPATTALENHGTFTNGERRIQLVRPAVNPPGEARQDWRVIRDLAVAMGESWDYDSPADVMDEIARVCPPKFGGIRYDRLEGDGLQWPCPAPDHAGTATVHADGFVRGRGKFTAIDYCPSPEHAGNGYPWLLITGRILEHYNVGTMTRRTPNQQLVADDVLEVHPEDAAAAGLVDDQPLLIESHWGEARAPARLSSRVARGTVFLSFHHPQTHTNSLVGPHVDPLSKCPEYKVTAVRVRPADHA